MTTLYKYNKTRTWAGQLHTSTCHNVCVWLSPIHSTALFLCNTTTSLIGKNLKISHLTSFTPTLKNCFCQEYALLLFILSFSFYLSRGRNYDKHNTIESPRIKWFSNNHSNSMSIYSIWSVRSYITIYYSSISCLDHWIEQCWHHRIQKLLPRLLIGKAWWLHS